MAHAPTPPRLSPPRVASAGVRACAPTGGGHTCGITTGRSLYCWGYNAAGTLGDGTTTHPRLSPRRIGTAGVWASVGPGTLHTCAISTGKSLYCWGYNDNGQVGDGTNESPRVSPKRIGAAGAWARVTGSIATSCAITTASSLYCWGDNDHGELGDGTTTPRFSPRKIA